MITLYALHLWDLHPLVVAGSVLIANAYILSRDAFFGGRSIGKRIIGLQVVDMTDRPCTFWKSCIRNLIVVVFMYVPGLLIIEYIAMRSSREQRRIGDYMAKTRVIDLRPEQADSKFFWYSLLIFIIIAWVWSWPLSL